MKRVRIRILVPLWGATYYDRWFRVPGLSLRSPGNVPYLLDHADVELVFLTKAEDLTFLRNHPLFLALSAEMPVKAITIDEFFPVQGTVPYGVPLTLAYAKGIKDLGEEGIGTFVILLNADFVLSNNSLANLFSRIVGGFHIVTAPSLRVLDHYMRPILSEQLTRSQESQGLSSRAMMRLAEEFLHQTVSARTLNQPGPVEAWYYHLLYWRVNEHCLAARYFLLMPFCFQLRRHFETVTCSVDYGFIEQLCPGGRYTVMQDSDEFLMLELQDRDSEAALLRVSERFASSRSMLDRKFTQITANVAEWSTREHRRAAAYTLLFHSDDLPADIDAQLLEFNQRMDHTLANLPEPVSTFRHFHWLGAVHHYRPAISATGLPAYPKLLWDEGNDIMVNLFEVSKEAISRALPQWPPTDGLAKSANLLAYLQAASTIITLDGLAPELSGLQACERVFSAKLEDAHHPDMQMLFFLPDDFTFQSGETLGVYLLVDSLAHWPKFRHICDQVLESGGKVILLFRSTRWDDINVQENTWILSILKYFFSNPHYLAEVTLIPLPELAGNTNQTSIDDRSTLAFSWRRNLPIIATKHVGLVVRLSAGQKA